MATTDLFFAALWTVLPLGIVVAILYALVRDVETRTVMAMMIVSMALCITRARLKAWERWGDAHFKEEENR